MIVAMPAGATFCRLVLGDLQAAAAAAQAARPAADRVGEVTAAWVACAPELARRRAALSWEDPPVAPGTPPLVQRLQRLADTERAAVVAQALGLTPTEVERALGAGYGEAPGLLARGHAALAGLGRPDEERCRHERERLAVEDTPRTTHADEGCWAFAEAVEDQRAVLQAIAGERPAGKPPRPPGTPRLSRRGRRAASPKRPAGAVGPVRAGRPKHVPATGTLPERVSAVLDQTETGPRVVVAVVVALLAGLAGFGAVSAFERDAPDRGSGVVTATPVGPLPPGVGATGPTG